MAEVAKKGRPRLGPDPSVAIGDIQKCLHEFLQRHGSSDIDRLLHPPNPISWKTSPDGEWLGMETMCDLFSNLFILHGNGVMASSKVQRAIMKLQNEKGRLNYSKKHDADWCDALDEKLRIAAQQYRDLKRDPMKYARCCKKVSVKELKNIDTVLQHLQDLQDAPVTSLVEQEQVPADNDGKPVPAEKIFEKVLKREASDPASPSFVSKNAKAAETSMSTVASSSWQKPGTASLADGAFDLGEDEALELKSWMEKHSTLEKKVKKKAKGNF